MIDEEWLKEQSFSASEMVEIMKETFHIHPEICPHRYVWITKDENTSSNVRTEKQRCRLCGKEIIILENKEDI